MKKIYTWGGKFSDRNITIADIIKSKGKKKLLQTTAINSEESAAAKEAGFDMLLCKSPNIQNVRQGAPAIFLTATIGVYCARVEGLSTIKSGFLNIYKNKPPIYEMISGASIAIAACLLILPGFLTDAIGFIILFPLTRKYLIKSWLKKNYKKEEQFNGGTIDGEIIEEKDKKSDEL